MVASKDTKALKILAPKKDAHTLKLYCVKKKEPFTTWALRVLLAAAKDGR